MPELSHLNQAIRDFRRARRQAELQELLAKVTGNPTQLLSYEEVRKQLHAVEAPTSTLQSIPLEDIVGSVGRYRDFNRSFLPKQNSDEQRWASVNMAMTGLKGVPPIEVYKLGEVYFVRDGNHRVSIARQFGANHIEAYVTEVHSNVTIDRDVRPDDLIVKAEYNDFLDKTSLHRLRPESDLTLTAAGKYQSLLEHIDVHRYFMGLDGQRDVSYQEAVEHWYDKVYLPVVIGVRELDILAGFPKRTEADLYLWLADHRAELEQHLGWELKPSQVLIEVASNQGTFNATRSPDVLSLDVRDYVRPKKTVEIYRQRRNDRLSDDILVAISGTENSWLALEQAVVLAKREGAKLYGVHVLSQELKHDEAQISQLQQQFQEICERASVVAQLAVVDGDINSVLVDRAKWVDLLIANLAHPPTKTLLPRLSSGFEALIRRSRKPILAVPGRVTALERPLVAYNGDANSKIALFAASYLALRWSIPIHVLTVQELGQGKQTLDKARNYLSAYDIEASFSLQSGNVVQSILSSAEEQQSDLILIGSYKYSVLFEPLLGGVVDEFLRQSQLPTLICQ